MTKFKVGDKVRVLDTDEFVPQGTILTVSSGPEGVFGGGNYYFEGYSQDDTDYAILGGDLAIVTEVSE